MKLFAKYVVDIGLLISFLLVTITGILKFRSFLDFFGITIDYATIPIKVFSKIHDWSGLAMAVLVLIHLILNWDWIICTTKHYFSRIRRKK